MAGVKVTVQRLTALVWSGDAGGTLSSAGSMVTQGVCRGERLLTDWTWWYQGEEEKVDIKGTSWVCGLPSWMGDVVINISHLGRQRVWQGIAWGSLLKVFLFILISFIYVLFLALLGLHCFVPASSSGHGFSLWWLLWVGHRLLERMGSVAPQHEDLPGPGIKPCTPYWQVDSHPLDHRGSPCGGHLFTKLVMHLRSSI